MADLEPPGSIQMSPALVTQVQTQLNDMYGKPSGYMRFPGTNAVSATPRNLEKLRGTQHVLMPKTDGKHMMLLLTRSSDAGAAEPVAYMVSRRRETWRVPIAAPASFFDGTLCEGELIRCEDDMVEFRCFKVLWVRGTNLRKYKFADRHLSLQFGTEDVEAGRTACGPYSTEPGLRLVRKTMHAPKEARALYEAHQGPHCDGLILIPNVSDFKTGRVYDEIKWKDVHTLDFVFKMSASPSGKPRLNILYSIHNNLVDISSHFVFAGHNVYAQHVKTPAYRAWKKEVVPKLKPEVRD